MKLPRDLKGSDLAKALCRNWGYRIVHQEGSHLILQTEIPSHQRISVSQISGNAAATLSRASRPTWVYRALICSES